MGRPLYSLQYEYLPDPSSPEALSPGLQEVVQLGTDLLRHFEGRQFMRWSTVLNGWWNVSAFRISTAQ